jgi:hypothetical protein
MSSLPVDYSFTDPQIARIGLIGILSCGFCLEYRMIHGHLAFQELFRVESDPDFIRHPLATRFA